MAERLLAATLVSSLLLTACGQPHVAKEESKAVQLSADRAHILGPNFNKLRTCQEVKDEKNLTFTSTGREFTLTIDDLKVKALHRNLTKTGGGTVKDAGVTKGTKWDFDLEFPPGTPPSNARQTVRIIVQISDNEHSNNGVKLRGDDYTITAGNLNGLEMFCDLDLQWGGDKTKIVRFTAFGAGTGMPEIGSFNVGLNVADGNHVTPVFIDPNVKNDG